MQPEIIPQQIKIFNCKKKTSTNKFFFYTQRKNLHNLLKIVTANKKFPNKEKLS